MARKKVKSAGPKTINVQDVARIETRYYDGTWTLSLHSLRYSIHFHLTLQWIQMLARRIWEAMRNYKAQVEEVEASLREGQ